VNKLPASSAGYYQVLVSRHHGQLGSAVPLYHVCVDSRARRAWSVVRDGARRGVNHRSDLRACLEVAALKAVKAHRRGRRRQAQV
jgi:hypothetical protein